MTRIDPIQTIHQERGPRSRSFASKVAIFATAAALAIAPALVTGTAANAAGPVVVTTPADGATGVQGSFFPFVVDFAGSNIPVGDYANITYEDATGVERQGSNTGGTNPDGNWTQSANFLEMSPGQTTVTVTVSGYDNNTLLPDPTVDPTTITFTFAVAPVPSNPLTITSPTSGQVVTDTTPTFTGTGNPGATIQISYSARALGNGIAADEVLVGANGQWSVDDTTFAELEPGATDVRAIIRQFNPDGTPVAGQEQTLVDFVFAESPAPLDPLTVTTEPGTVTQAQASSTGVAFLATGFSPNEGLTIEITDQNGGAVNVPQAEPFFSDDTDGTFVGVVLLPTTAGTGTYTITVNGVRSTRTAAGTFVVVANPVTPGTPGTPGASGSLPVVSG